MPSVLIADSGSTKSEWCLISGKTKKKLVSKAMSPYFVTTVQLKEMITEDVLSQLEGQLPDKVFFYGTGCANTGNIKSVKTAISTVFPSAQVFVDHDMTGAAKALCGDEKGIACILGTGSSSCYYNGKTIKNLRPGLGYVLGDEGSGSYLGRKVLQYYLYETFDDDLRERFEAKYHTDRVEILNSVYKKPFPNRYLASFTRFLSENRGHFMIENILEDSFCDFFTNHIFKFKESWLYPINFTGGVAFVFRDVIEELCNNYELQLGKIIKDPIDGLIKYHQAK